MPSVKKRSKKTRPENSAFTNSFGVVLAGGSGTRFWPKSRLKTPKQLCALGNNTQAMLAITLDRFDRMIPPERRLIVTHREQLNATRKCAGRKCPCIIPEPQARNTAPAIALAALAIEAMASVKKASDPETGPIMISVHADHVINDLPEFRRTLERAIKVAQGGWLTLLGVVPGYPETGYGYIERGPSLHLEPMSDDASGFQVAAFKEKPDLQTAENYVASKRFLWNSGLFVFPVRQLLKELDQHLPADMKALRKCIKTRFRTGESPVDTARLARIYPKLTKISIDEAILEKSKNIAVVDADFDWQDVGSWDALSKAFPASDPAGNLVAGPTILVDTTNTTIDTDGPLVAAVGLKDMVVVCHKGAILVCPKNRAQEVKKVVEKLQAGKKKQLL